MVYSSTIVTVSLITDLRLTSSLAQILAQLDMGSASVQTVLLACAPQPSSPQNHMVSPL